MKWSSRVTLPRGRKGTWRLQRSRMCPFLGREPNAKVHVLHDSIIWHSWESQAVGTERRLVGVGVWGLRGGRNLGVKKMFYLVVVVAPWQYAFIRTQKTLCVNYTSVIPTFTWNCEKYITIAYLYLLFFLVTSIIILSCNLFMWNVLLLHFLKLDQVCIPGMNPVQSLLLCSFLPTPCRILSAHILFLILASMSWVCGWPVIFLFRLSVTGFSMKVIFLAKGIKHCLWFPTFSKSLCKRHWKYLCLGCMSEFRREDWSFVKSVLTFYVYFYGYGMM